MLKLAILTPGPETAATKVLSARLKKIVAISAVGIVVDLIGIWAVLQRQPLVSGIVVAAAAAFVAVTVSGLVSAERYYRAHGPAAAAK